MHPLERLVNLVALLLEVRTPLTFDEIRSLMPAYRQEDPASAKRMFERDKDTLREVGVPLETAPTDVWEVEHGYRIPKDRYYLPEIAFTPEEVWALFVAAQAQGESSEGERAFWKLATGVDTTVLATIADRPVAPGVDASGPHLGAVAEAVARGRRVRFRYRSSTGRTGQRTVDPWALLFRKGNWYVVGEDATKKEIRSYRLSRISGPVRDTGEGTPPPEGFQASRHLQAGQWGLGEPDVVARVAFRPEVAWAALAATTGATVVGTGDDGWIEAEVPASRSDAFVSWILSHGPDARLVSPSWLRDEVVARLRTLVGDG